MSETVLQFYPLYEFLTVIMEKKRKIKEVYRWLGREKNQHIAVEKFTISIQLVVFLLKSVRKAVNIGFRDKCK